MPQQAERMTGQQKGLRGPEDKRSRIVKFGMASIVMPDMFLGRRLSEGVP